VRKGGRIRERNEKTYNSVRENALKKKVIAGSCKGGTYNQTTIFLGRDVT